MPTLAASPVLQLPFSGTINTWPINQGYGHPYNVYGAEPSGHGYAHWHRGIDFGCPSGTQMYACAPGVVSIAGLATGGNATPNGGYGLMLVIDHSSIVPGLQTLYGHQSSLMVTVGQTVYQGQPVSLSGGGPPSGPGTNSGNSTGAHLHWEVDLYGNDVNPAEWLAAGSSTVYPSGQPIGAQSGDVFITPQQAVYYARQAGLPEDQIPTAVAICYAESRFKINATHLNPGKSDCGYNSTDYGLWQINTGCNPQFDSTQLVTDPAYNARAMVSLSGGGKHWAGIWTTYGGHDYNTYYPSAVAAWKSLPPGSAPPAAIATPYAPWPGVPENQPQYVDNTPQLPPTRVNIVPVAVKAPDTAQGRGLIPRALLWIAAGSSSSGMAIPLETVNCHIPGYTNPGTWNGRVSLQWLRDHGYIQAVQAAIDTEFTEIAIYLGYTSVQKNTLLLDDLTPVFAGFLDQPTEDYQSNAHDYIDLSGPDMSGLFSGNGSTKSLLSQDSFVNKPADQLVREIVDGHNLKKGTGLTVDYQTANVTAGQFFGSDFVTTRTSGQTEWDIITQLGQGLGYVTYFRGTTLVFKPLPPPSKPQPIQFALNNVPASSTTRIRVLHKPHRKRDYRIVTASYNSDLGYTIHAVHGNQDSTSEIWVDMPPNTPYSGLHSKGIALQKTYSATEMLVEATSEGFVPYAVGQSVYIQSDRVLEPSLDRILYPFDIQYDYSRQSGAKTMLQCTTREYAVLDTVNSTDTPMGF